MQTEREQHACAHYNGDFDVVGNSAEMNESLVDFVGFEFAEGEPAFATQCRREARRNSGTRRPR